MFVLVVADSLDGCTVEVFSKSKDGTQGGMRRQVTIAFALFSVMSGRPMSFSCVREMDVNGDIRISVNGKARSIRLHVELCYSLTIEGKKGLGQEGKGRLCEEALQFEKKKIT